MTIVNPIRHRGGQIVRPTREQAEAAYYRSGQDDFVGPPRLTKDAGYVHVQRFERFGHTHNLARQALGRTMENFARAMSRVRGYRILDVHEEIKFTSGGGYKIDVYVVYAVEAQRVSEFASFFQGTPFAVPAAAGVR